MATDHRTIPDKIKYDYTFGAGSPIRRTLEGVQTLLSHSLNPRVEIERFLNEVLVFIQRQFEIDNASIGLLDPKDGLYRYKAHTGFRADAAEAFMKIAYRKEQFFENTDYHGSTISKYSRIYLQEDNPPSEAERLTYGHPGLLGMERKDSTTGLEGDYIDTGIYDGDDNLIGWIEFSGTRTRKLPDATTIRWIEIIASIVATALMRRGLTGKS